MVHFMGTWYSLSKLVLALETERVVVNLGKEGLYLESVSCPHISASCLPELELEDEEN